MRRIEAKIFFVLVAVFFSNVGLSGDFSGSPTSFLCGNFPSITFEKTGVAVEGPKRLACRIGVNKPFELWIYADVIACETHIAETGARILAEVQNKRQVYARATKLIADPLAKERDQRPIRIFLDDIELPQESLGEAGPSGYFSASLLGPDTLLLNHPDIWLRGQDFSDEREIQILAHELTHLLHSLYRTDDPLWIREGLAQVVSWEVYRRGRLLFMDLQDTSRSGFHRQMSLRVEAPLSPHDYQYVGQFMQYLFDHYGHVNFIRAFLESKIGGESALEESIHSSPSGKKRTFPQIFSDFNVALMLNDVDYFPGSRARLLSTHGVLRLFSEPIGTMMPFSAVQIEKLDSSTVINADRGIDVFNSPSSVVLLVNATEGELSYALH